MKRGIQMTLTELEAAAPALKEYTKNMPAAAAP